MRQRIINTGWDRIVRVVLGLGLLGLVISGSVSGLAGLIATGTGLSNYCPIDGVCRMRQATRRQS